MGLYADYRDVSVQIPYDSATVIGVLLEFSHKIQNREWNSYNSLNQQDRTLVNFLMQDRIPRGTRPGKFVQVPDMRLYKGGDRWAGRRERKG